jgi:hypothetical protein
VHRDVVAVLSVRFVLIVAPHCRYGVAFVLRLLLNISSP